MKNKKNPNPWSVADEIAELQNELRLGNFDFVQKKIKAWLKKNSPRPFERIKLSEYYTWMGLDSQSAKILGPPMSRQDLKEMDPAELCIQLRLAYVLGMMGVKYVALSLMKNIRAILDERGENLIHHYPQFYQNYAYLHLSYYLTHEARWGFTEALNLYEKHTYQYFYISLGLSDCDAIDGEYASAVNRIKELIESKTTTDKLLLATGAQAIGEYLNYDQKFSEATLWFEKSLADFGERNQSKDYAYLLKHMGLGHIWQGQKSAGIEKLLEAKKLLERPDQTPTSLIEILYWLETYDPSTLSLEERLTLRAYPNYSVYSFKAGRQKSFSDQTHAPKWVPEMPTPSQSDSWLVHQGKITDLEYSEISHPNFQEQLIDLSSSLVFENGKVINNLSELQARLLLALSGAGERGVHQYLMVDYIYQQEFVSWETGLDRIKKALKGLSSHGIKVSLKNSNYIWENNDFALIIPKNLKPEPWLGYAKKQLQGPFTSEMLAQALETSTRTAQRILKDWRQANLVDSLADRTYGWRE